VLPEHITAPEAEGDDGGCVTVTFTALRALVHPPLVAST
jgi:hypothetical protein